MATSYRKSLDFILVRITQFPASADILKCHGKIRLTVDAVMSLLAVRLCDVCRNTTLLEVCNKCAVFQWHDFKPLHTRCRVSLGIKGSDCLHRWHRTTVGDATHEIAQVC